MAEEASREHDERQRSYRAERSTEMPEQKHSLRPQDNVPVYPSSLLTDAHLKGRGNGPVVSSMLKSMQQSRGNQATRRYLQRSASDFRPGADEDVARRIEAKAGSGSGSSLDTAARSKLEVALGADLSGVRVHTDAEADRLARSVSASAFTTGQDIFFREGTFNPYSPEGLGLLAHEVTHTVQQAAGPVSGTPAAGGVSISDPSDSFEQEADIGAARVMMGLSARDGMSAQSTSSGPATAHSGSSSTSGSAVQRGDYPWSGPKTDAVSSVAWDVMGLIPGVSEIASVAGTAIDVGKAGIDVAFGDDKAAQRHWHDAQYDALGMIPGVGEAQSALNLGWDSTMAGARFAGANEEEAPLSGDMWDKYAGPLMDKNPLQEWAGSLF